MWVLDVVGTLAWTLHLYIYLGLLSTVSFEMKIRSLTAFSFCLFPAMIKAEENGYEPPVYA